MTIVTNQTAGNATLPNAAVDTGVAVTPSPAPSPFAVELPQPGANPATDAAVASPRTAHSA